jgi:hypothetical protein
MERAILCRTGTFSHVQHGTWAAYTTDKCRCAECREAGMRARRRQRDRRRLARSARHLGRLHHRQVPVPRVPEVQIRLHEGVPSTTALGLAR